nr:DUF4271 domain-containing protein [Pontibacter silvestris]
MPLEQKNTITNEWMVYEPGATRLVPYITGVHSDYNAIHQWLSVTPKQPFEISFIAPKDLCLFLNNQLIFKADYPAKFTIDITKYSAGIDAVEGKYLLTVWHPQQQPNITSFKNLVREQDQVQVPGQRPLSVRVREYVNQNAFIVFLLLIGLIYGWLKTNFTADFISLFRIDSFLSTNRLEQGFFSKPLGSWSNLLFVLAFSLSLALLIAAIHTNVQQVLLFNSLFPISEADITTKIAFYAFLIFMFIVLKYIFLKVLAYIFGLEQVVQVQYKEFIRTVLFLGIFLPIVMLLYLALNAAMPDTVLLISNLAVSLLLVVAIIRVFVTVNKKATVLNLHLFSYLCATEVIPLAIMLKLIVFNF